MPPPAAKSGSKPGSKLAADPTAPLEPGGLERATSDELTEACRALEDELEELKAKYEMYFLGVELREPAKWREELKKQVLRLKEAFTRNTGLRFRIQTLHARFLSYERLWQRAAREREEGTYRRDVEKAKRHARGGAVPGLAPIRPKRAGKPRLADEDVDLSDFSGDEEAHGGVAPAGPPAPGTGAPPLAARAGESTAGSPGPAAGLPRPGTAPLPATKPVAGVPVLTPAPGARPPRKDAPPTLQRIAPALTPPPRPAAPAPPPPAPAPRLGEQQMRELYDAYVTAKKRCNEDVSKLSYDAVARSVTKQIPEIMQQHKARAVEFKVVIKNGKARLTAVPKV